MTTSIGDSVPRASVGEFELHGGDQMSRAELQQGMSTRAHAAFVDGLARAKTQS